MKISNNWLKKYITTDHKVEKIGDFLTDIGLEVEGIEKFESIPGGLEGIVVGKVLSCEKHPNADKLKLTKVDVGQEEPLSIVCGAPNVAEGQLVPVATINTKIGTGDGNFFVIKKAKLRGEPSEGMICSETELKLGDNNDGIMVLDPEKFEVGEPLSKYYEIEIDDVFEIGLTPNRTDAMSHFGVARDLNAFLSSNQMKDEYQQPSEIDIEETEEPSPTIQVEDEDLCPKYLGVVLENVTVKESPTWLKNRLSSIGIKPTNNIVDATNYVLHDLGQPLHAFDKDKMKGDTVKVGTCPEGTKFVTLDGVERILNGNEIMIKDEADTPLCMAGILGGNNSEVDDQTTTIFLESAYFDPVAIRKAAKYHAINTDASFRFERGVDPNSTRLALTHAVDLIKQLSGATVKGSIVEEKFKDFDGHYVILRYSKLEEILGIKMHREKIKEILKYLDIDVLNEIPNGLEVNVPNYRFDVTREIDVIEEVLRIYGYNKIEIPEKMSFTPVKLSDEDLAHLANSWARTLQSNGFYEVMNNSLTSLKDTTNAVKLLNPLSSDLEYMRTSLLGGLMQNAQYNINRKNEDLKLFEIGKSYFKIDDAYKEINQIALLVSGHNYNENWKMPTSPTDFYFLKGYVNILMEKLGVDYQESGVDDPRFSDAIAYTINNSKVAILGVVADDIKKDKDVDQDCYYAEINLDIAQAVRKKGNFKFKDIPKFNKIRRDLAFLTDADVKYADLYNEIMAMNIPLVQRVFLFDIYEGDKIPEGKKSYALGFELLSNERTLEDKEINATMEKIIHKLSEKLPVELRG